MTAPGPGGPPGAAITTSAGRWHHDHRVPGLPDPTTLRAVTVALRPEPAIDPYALAGRRGVLFADARLALAGRGLAAVLELPGGLQDGDRLAAVQRWMAAVPHTDRVGRPGSKVTALGALPFDRSAPGRLVVPELTVGRDEGGHQWVTVVAPGPAGPDQHRIEAVGDEVAALGRSAGPPPPPGPSPAGRGHPVLTPRPTGPDYARSVAAALARIAGGAIGKVVLARSLEARFADVLTTAEVVRRLHDQEPSCTIFAFPAEPPPGRRGGGDGRRGDGRFLGASPELLVARRGAQVTCHPLAGTVGLDDRVITDAAEPDHREAETMARFLASPKERVEHQLVVDEIVSVLGPRCGDLSVPAGPSLVRLHTVAHLGTVVAGTLHERLDGGGPPSVLELLAELHPTPAVGGVPRHAALACIADLETAPRGQWAGPVGWVDATGDGRWMIGIRSATVEGPVAHLTAGAGIVAGSDPQAELAETTVKLAPVLDAFAPGAAGLL